MITRTPPASSRRPPAARRPRGVASLVVVLVLFFIVSLVAAYTSRNLIFEQRTSANQYRSTQAIEAAEAGLEWAVAMLNHGRITAACTTSTLFSDTAFRERYLDVDAAGQLIARLTSTGAALTPTCVSDGSSWQCDCPADAAPALAAPTGDGVFPAFRVRFVNTVVTGHPGIVRLESVACTRLDDDCLSFAVNANGTANEGRAYVSAMLAVSGGVAATPRAALTALGDVTLGGGGIYNADVPIQAGGAVNTDPSVVFRPAAGSFGTPQPVSPDPALIEFAAAPDRLFAATFSMWSPVFRAQPAALVLDCAPTCDAAAVRALVAMNPGRPIWVDGDLAIDSGGDIGSPAAPVVLAIGGDLDVSTAGATVHGLVYVQTADWLDTGPVQVNGALVVEGNVTGAPVISYDPGLLNRLRYSVGSFVRVPGSWRDFTP